MPPPTEDAAAASGEHGFSFGRFRLFPARRQLLEGDDEIRLGSRAFDILVALVERAGRLVPKEELIARVWPNLVVEESNLKRQRRCSTLSDRDSFLRLECLTPQPSIVLHHVGWTW